MSTPNLQTATVSQLVRVSDLADFDYLVKESEIVTGRAGRDFVVLGADRPAFRVTADLAGYEIERLDAKDPSACGRQLATARDLQHHTLGAALLCGMLFAVPLQ